MVYHAGRLSGKPLSRDKQLASFRNCLLLVLAEDSEKTKEVVKLICLLPECITNTDSYDPEYESHKYHPECSTWCRQVIIPLSSFKTCDLF